MAQSADDGNVYVLRQASRGPLFSISPGGKVREIALPGYQNGIINAAMVARGQLLVHYIKPTNDIARLDDLRRYSLYDLMSMEKIADYRVEEGPLTNSLPACYTVDQLTFLKVNPQGKLSFLIATPR